MPIALNAFVDLSLQDILDIEAKAVTAATTGGTVSSWSSAGNAVTKLVDGSPSDILRACQFAKRYKNPEIYGRNVTRTAVSFRSNTEDG